MNDLHKLMLTILLLAMLLIAYHFYILPLSKKIIKTYKKRREPPLQIIKPEARREVAEERERKARERRKKMRIIE